MRQLFVNAYAFTQSFDINLDGSLHTGVIEIRKISFGTMRSVVYIFPTESIPRPVVTHDKKIFELSVFINGELAHVESLKDNRVYLLDQRARIINAIDFSQLQISNADVIKFFDSRNPEERQNFINKFAVLVQPISSAPKPQVSDAISGVYPAILTPGNLLTN